MRKSEVFNMKWGDVDLKRGLIAIRETKNNETRYIPMNETLTETLRNVKKRVDTPYVFHDKDGNPFKELKNGFASALRRAGIAKFRFHDLRHTFASYLVMSGVDIVTVSKLLGHKSLQITMRYSHLRPAHQKQAVNRLESYINSGQKNEVATYVQHRDLVKSAV